MVPDGVLSKGGGLEVVGHGAGSKDDVEVVLFPGKEAFLAKEAVVPCYEIPSHNHCRTHLKTHLDELLKIVCQLPGIGDPLNTLVSGETQGDSQSLVSFCCYEYHNLLVDAFPHPGLVLDGMDVLLIEAENAFFSCDAFYE